MKVSNEITVYEVDGEEPKGLPMPIALVESHGHISWRVVLVTPKGERLTVIASDLEMAIRNATNVRS